MGLRGGVPNPAPGQRSGISVPTPGGGGGAGAGGQPLGCFAVLCPSPQATLQSGPNLGHWEARASSLSLGQHHVKAPCWLGGWGGGPGLAGRLRSHLEQPCRAAPGPGPW